MTKFLNIWNTLRYTLYSPFYGLIIKALSKGRIRSLELLDLKVGDKVLIVGCGRGEDLRHLLKGIKITAVDITPLMVSYCASEASILGLDAKCMVMSGDDLKFNEEEFDVIILNLILAVIPDPLKCLQECERVLKREGVISVFDKFLAENKSAGIFRRLFGVLTNLLATNINRKLKPLADGSDLKITKLEPLLFKGNFVGALLHKK